LPVGSRLRIWELAARIARARGQRGLGRRRIRRAARYLEDHRSLIPGWELRARAFERQVRVYHEWIALLLDSPRPDPRTLLGVMEAARGRGFRERLLQGDRETPPEITRKRSVLGSMVRRLEKMELGGDPSADRSRMDAARRKILALEREITRDVRRFETQRTEAAARPETARPEDIARLLRNDEVLVEYFVVGDVCLAVVLRPDATELLRLPASAPEMQQAVENLRLQIDFLGATAAEPLGNLEFLRSAAEADLAHLYRSLLAPLENRLPPRGRLILVPHSFLHLVPFEALHDGDGYIDRKWVVSRAPTADFLVRRRMDGGAASDQSVNRDKPHGDGSDGRQTSGAILIAGMVEGGPPFVAKELESVEAVFGRRAVKSLRDPAPAELLEQLSRSRIAHLTTHGQYRSDNPLFSRLSFGEGALFVADILERRLRSQLVVLSACNSGRVFTGQGDDLAGVAHSFLAAGAANLVAGLWRLHDEASASWMSAFYASFTADAAGDPALALNLAGQETRRSWNHPFFWGGFCVHGA
ncbi:MAG: CHAT domain-containing protein, partial [Candidatus Eisenbacteria bacterium]|nr:CHAT domain-containing protein [Candidatus Eisenbacteria bacterium]